MPSYPTEQRAHESFEMALHDENEHIDPLEHWELDDFHDLLGVINKNASTCLVHWFAVMQRCTGWYTANRTVLKRNPSGLR